jgi:hypothetical protein
MGGDWTAMQRDGGMKYWSVGTNRFPKVQLGGGKKRWGAALLSEFPGGKKV